MIATIRDAETLRRVRPAEAAAYLRSHAWKQTTRVGEQATIWTKSADEAGEYEILLPLDPTLRDYARRIAEVLQTLEVAEARSQIAIVQDIAAATADVVRIRLEHGLIDNGAVPLDYALRMLEQTQALLFAAACAALYPQAWYGRRKPTRALTYLRGLRMGPTEPGSFSLTIQSPVAPRLEVITDADGEYWADETPFERAVTLTLANALAAAQQAVNAAAASGTFAPFDTAIQSGVSANLCDALVALGGKGTAEAITIDIHWSSSRPVAPAVPTQARFGRDAFPLLREAARLLREAARLLRDLDDIRSLAPPESELRRLPA